MKINPVLQHIKDVRETKSIQEVVELLLTREWIVIAATPGENPTFALGKVDFT